MPDNNELDKFFEGIKQDVPKLDDQLGLAPTDEPAGEDEASREEAPKLNRQERRARENASIRQQLQEEREARIAAEAREQAMKELGKTGNVDERLLKLYGDTENGKLAAQLHAEMLADVENRATERAYERIQQESQQADAEERYEEAFIDDQLINLEEEHSIDLTSNSPAARKARTEFLELVEQLSPKDEEGNIVEYADFASTFDVYQRTSKRQTNPRAKELSDRSMSKSAQANLPKEEDDKNRSWLRQMGINV